MEHTRSINEVPTLTLSSTHNRAVSARRATKGAHLLVNKKGSIVGVVHLGVRPATILGRQPDVVHEVLDHVLR